MRCAAGGEARRPAIPLAPGHTSVGGRRRQRHKDHGNLGGRRDHLREFRAHRHHVGNVAGQHGNARRESRAGLFAPMFDGSSRPGMQQLDAQDHRRGQVMMPVATVAFRISPGRVLDHESSHDVRERYDKH